MAFTSKISNIIRNNVSNLAGNAAGNIFNGLVAKAGQPEKLAAKIANKSPLDLSKSPVAHMEAQNNPFSYGQLYYPTETSNLGDGHYVIFDVIASNDTKYNNQTFNNSGQLVQVSETQVGERKRQNALRLSKLKSQGFVSSNATDIVRKQSTGAGSISPTHSRLQDSIILYTPPSTKFDYKVGYENVEEGAFGGLLADMFTGDFDAKAMLENAGGAGKAFLENVLKGAVELLIPGVGGIVDKRRGYTQNPKQELVFKNVPFRAFNFPFEFAPKNQKELETVHKIIQLFKFHMMPEKRDNLYLTAPSEFQITYMYRDKANAYIPKVSRCALTDMSVDYSPEGVFSTFKGDERGAAPTITKMDLSFTEMEIMTKETVAEGF